ncbi:MAG: ATP-binding cassette domain-containing protein [Candidatus Peregrinibacteria bacterium]
MLVLKNVSTEAHDHTALHDISLVIHPGELVCIVGKSRSGKSMLLSVLAGLQQPSGGSIEVDGIALKSIPPMALRLLRRKVGIVPQSGQLIAHLTVQENVALPLEVTGAPDAIIMRRIPELLRRLHLLSRKDSLPASLTIFEKVQVALARAIALPPMILLADEPLSDLDRSDAAEIAMILREIHLEGPTVIVTTRDPTLPSLLGCRAIHLANGTITSDSGSPSPSSVPPPVMLQKSARMHGAEALSSGEGVKRRKVHITAINS